MKHLRLFESFSGDDLISTIKDILLELEDEGYVITYSHTNRSVTINIKAGFEFKLKDISDTLLRLFNYNKSYNISSSGKKTFYTYVYTLDRIMGAKILGSSIENKNKIFNYILNIGKDDRFYSERGRPSTIDFVGVSKKVKLKEVEITIFF